MTSIRCDAQPVFVEFPNFGFGPASAALATIEGVGGPYEWHLVSSGAAAAFARAERPTAHHHELDTSDRGKRSDFLKLVASDALVISVTNPDFATWAAENGYKVGIVDTLNWMWASLPAGVARSRFHLAQSFFSASMDDRRLPSVEVVQPIVDQSLWSAGEFRCEAGTAVISFGGMHLPLPLGRDLVDVYARWFLESALSILVKQAGMSRVSIVGGRSDLKNLVPPAWQGHPAVDVRSRMERHAYAKLLRSAEHVLLSPGLGSLYECAAGGLGPLLQPAWSVSMAFQAYHASRTSYEHICAWPWLEEAVGEITDLPEHEGFAYLARRIRETIHDDRRSHGSLLSEPILGYLGRSRTPPLRLPVPGALPSAADRVRHHLRTLA